MFIKADWCVYAFCQSRPLQLVACVWIRLAPDAKAAEVSLILLFQMHRRLLGQWVWAHAVTWERKAPILWNNVGQVMISSLAIFSPPTVSPQKIPPWQRQSPLRGRPHQPRLFTSARWPWRNFFFLTIKRSADICLLPPRQSCLILCQEGDSLSGNRRFLLLTEESSACPPGARGVTRARSVCLCERLDAITEPP